MFIEQLEAEIRVALNNLNSIDFIPIFKKAKSFNEVIKMLEEEYGDYVLNVISTDEFADYINDRYKGKIKIYEVSSYIFELKL